jgi:hypothetical protein
VFVQSKKIQIRINKQNLLELSLNGLQNSAVIEYIQSVNLICGFRSILQRKVTGMRSEVLIIVTE